MWFNVVFIPCVTLNTLFGLLAQAVMTCKKCSARSTLPPSKMYPMSRVSVMVVNWTVV